MNAGRFVGAGLAVWVVRTVLNWLFYGVLTQAQMQQISDAHPGVFREVIPAFIITDLVAALIIVLLFTKVGGALGGGVKGGVVLGLFVGILAPVLADVYIYFSMTVFTVGATVADMAFQLVSHCIQGAIAGAVYKSA